MTPNPGAPLFARVDTTVHPTEQLEVVRSWVLQAATLITKVAAAVTGVDGYRSIVDAGRDRNLEASVSTGPMGARRFGRLSERRWRRILDGDMEDLSLGVGVRAPPPATAGTVAAVWSVWHEHDDVPPVTQHTLMVGEDYVPLLDQTWFDELVSALAELGVRTKCLYGYASVEYTNEYMYHYGIGESVMDQTTEAKGYHWLQILSAGQIARLGPLEAVAAMDGFYRGSILSENPPLVMLQATADPRNVDAETQALVKAKLRRILPEPDHPVRLGRGRELWI